jgi:acetylglutamate kinase
VVKIGGRTFEEPAGRARLLGEIAALAKGTSPPPFLVVVHGGGNRVSTEVQKAGITPQFVRGLRVTDEATLEVVERVLTLAGKEIAQSLSALGPPAIAVTGRDAVLLRASRRVELGYVGEVSGVNVASLRALLAAGFVPVVAPIALPEVGESPLLNVNADEVAGAVAADLRADRLLLLTDVDAVIGPRGPARQATVAEARAWISEGYAKDGMAPKLEAAIRAADRGVRVVIANGNRGGVVEAALRGSAGTEVIP